MIKIKQIKFIVISLLCVVLIVNCSLYVQSKESIVEFKETIEDTEEYIIEDYARFKSLNHPTVAVALTGGGAKAFFNIGVIKALEEEHIPIDLIVGTSMGSIIGAMYGSGLSIQQIEEVVTNAPFSKMLDISIVDDNSILETSKVNKFIEDIAPNKRLEDFPIPTALLTLELKRGSKYIITTGEISKVIQASYAIPYFFPTLQLQENYFADPGIVENTPAKAAKVLGADFIIGTTYVADTSNDTYKSPKKIVGRYVEIVGDRNTDRIINNYADIVIESDIGSCSFMNFDNADKLIQFGYRDAKKKISRIKEELKKRGIALREPKSRREVDLTEEFIDLKYDRLLVEPIRSKTLFYYGQSHSSFDHALFADLEQDFQYGLNFNKGHFEFDLLSSGREGEDLETRLRWRRLSDRTDLITKVRSDGENLDYKLGVKYYNLDRSIEIGGARINEENKLYCDSNYDLDTSLLDLKSKFEILYSPEDSFSMLASSSGKFRISSIWSVAPRVVFNNTDIISSPIIYRGYRPDESVELQATVDFNYTYNFIESLQLVNLLELTNIDLYLFGDYQSSRQGSLASGLGVGADLKLLGLKSIAIDIYAAHDDAGCGIEGNFIINYQF